MNTNYPKDDEETIYIESEFSTTPLSELLEKIKEKWGEVDFSKIHIYSEHRHVEHIGYDRYDPSDYTNYIVITRLIINN